jgi:hypothetical protein
MFNVSDHDIPSILILHKGINLYIAKKNAYMCN